MLPGQKDEKIDDDFQECFLFGEFGDSSAAVSDLSHIEEMIYHYADGRELSVLYPLQRSIGPDGSHHITCADRIGVEVPVVGLVKIEHLPRFDEACFPGHVIANEDDGD